MQKVVGFLLFAVLVVVVFIVTRPNYFQVERSATMNAPAEVIYAELADFHRWERWSPWEKLDPQMKRSYGGPASGVGAMYQWSGNDKVGEGRMTIIDAQPAEKVTIHLEFLKPWESTNVTTMTLAPEGQATRMTWTIAGENNLMAKAFSLFMNMDKMIGADFERGLASLKTVVEAKALKPAVATP